MKNHYEQEAALLNTRLNDRAAIAEEILRKAVSAVSERNAPLAAEVLAAAENIDRGGVRFEEECLKVLALHQPVAGDLRYVVTLLKVNTEIERIGDLAESIAERVPELCSFERPEHPMEVDVIAVEVREMLKAALDCLSMRDIRKAAEIISRDDVVDKLHYDNILSLKKEVVHDPATVGYYLGMLTVSRSLERVADCAVNIAEDVIYLEQGRIIRHLRP